MDYNVTASVFNVTISAGTTSSLFNINIIDDDLTHEDLESFSIDITLLPIASCLSLDISSSTVTIIDDDSKCLDYGINLSSLALYITC